MNAPFVPNLTLTSAQLFSASLWLHNAGLLALHATERPDLVPHALSSLRTGVAALGLEVIHRNKGGADEVSPATPHPHLSEVRPSDSAPRHSDESESDRILLDALQAIMADMRKQSPRLLTDRLQAAFVRDRLAENFEIYPHVEGLGR